MVVSSALQEKAQASLTEENEAASEHAFRTWSAYLHVETRISRDNKLVTSFLGVMLDISPREQES
jgi:hypothetical protein